MLRLNQDLSRLPDWLAAHGYGTAVYDACWMDCERSDGYRKTWRGKEICLCSRHANMLEAGKLNGTYRGAPLPHDSIATEWPWRPAQPVAVPAA